MDKIGIYDKYTAAVKRLNSADSALKKVRQKLEKLDVTVDNIGRLNSVFAEADQILKEYYEALREFQVYDHAGSYAVSLDVAMLNKERIEMIGILKRVINKKYSRDQIARLAKDFLRGKY